MLSWRAWAPLSKLTYGAYLVHPLIMFWYWKSMKTGFHMSSYSMVSYPLCLKCRPAYREFSYSKSDTDCIRVKKLFTKSAVIDSSVNKNYRDWMRGKRNIYGRSSWNNTRLFADEKNKKIVFTPLHFCINWCFSGCDVLWDFYAELRVSCCDVLFGGTTNTQLRSVHLSTEKQEDLKEWTRQYDQWKK